MFIHQRLPEIKTEMDLFRRDVEALLRYTKSLEVKSKKEAKVAINYISISRSLRQKIEEKKISVSEDLSVSKIDDIDKEFLDPLALAEDMILQKIDSWKIQHNEST